MKYVEWADPWPGHDGENLCTCALICRMTVEDAIKASRAYYLHMRPGTTPPSEDSLLDEFIILHWATIVEVPDGTLN